MLRQPGGGLGVRAKALADAHGFIVRIWCDSVGAEPRTRSTPRMNPGACARSSVSFEGDHAPDAAVKSLVSRAWCRAEEDRSLGDTGVDRKQSVVGGGPFNILVDFRPPRSVRPGGFPKKP